MPLSSRLMPQPWPATSPPQTKLTSRRLAGAVRKRPIDLLACDLRMRQVAEFDAIEDVLPGRKILQQHLCGEVALGQRRDRRQRANLRKGFRGRHLDHHLRGPVGARPHHAAVGADVAGLDAVGDHGAVGGAAEIGHRDAAERGNAGGRDEAAAGNSDCHGVTHPRHCVIPVIASERQRRSNPAFFLPQQSWIASLRSQ